MHNKKDDLFLSGTNSLFEAAAISVMGDREEQQDDFALILDNDTAFVVVCDGMGGHKGGKIASAVAVDTLITAYNQDREKVSDARFLMNVASEADRRISFLVDEDGNLVKAGSTLAALSVKNKELNWCAVGDSRIYLFRQGALAQITQDQNYKTVLEEKMNAHLISHEEYNKELSKGEMLINYLGIGNVSLFDHNSSPLKLIKDDRLILMTDGLYKILSDTEIKHIIDNFNNIDDAVKMLERKTRNISVKKAVDRDNMTIVILKIK